jgi:hypothetical protein
MKEDPTSNASGRCSTQSLAPEAKVAGRLKMEVTEASSTLHCCIIVSGRLIGQITCQHLAGFLGPGFWGRVLKPGFGAWFWGLVLGFDFDPGMGYNRTRPGGLLNEDIGSTLRLRV